MDDSRFTLLGVAMLAMSLNGCSPRKAAVGSPAASEAGAVACAPTLGRLPAGTSVAAIAGDYGLTLMATSGPRSGEKASGTLKFDLPRAMSSTTTSLTGTVSIALDKVGANAPGRASDVTALEWSTMHNNVATPEITIRFGSAAASGTIEGAHMALQLSTISGDGFFGAWTSGNGVSPMADAAGYFCARRVQ